ncbi:hypothetical protein N0V95_006034 [Ascochyta clinopodiicola]|nr:hypothetical protein N0V95_006034 [Ascochyta clinopodiicola]
MPYGPPPPPDGEYGPPRKGAPHREHGPPPPPPDGEYGPPRKGGPHREHGPPPPLPPGHIYKPYPPPPRKDRPYNGPNRPWHPDHHRGPPPDHDERLPEHHGPPPPGHGERHEYPESIELRSNPKRQVQQPLREADSPDKEPVGYLHTYIPKHPLRLLYIDGLSAGKTANGTLDTQDYLLLNLTTEEPDGPMGGEQRRAQGLCDLAATIWEDKVDGFIRLEGGFEIILCDFKKHLDRTDVVTVAAREGRGRGPMGGWQYTKAITSRYHGIGGERVHIDYDNFVSVFAYGDVEGLWDNDVRSDHPMPRLTNVSPATLHSIKDDVTSLVLSKNWDSTDSKGTNWQATADMLISRYSKPLHHITTHRPFRHNKEDLATYLTTLLKPFIDPRSRNATQETSRCTSQLLPPLPSLSVPPGSLTPLAHRALHAVATRICDTLLTSLSIALTPTENPRFSTAYAARAVDDIDDLVSWLGWSSWKECGTCADEEVCFIPIWPSGTVEDHARPRCRGQREAEARSGYWGSRWGPPPGKGKGGRKGLFG